MTRKQTLTVAGIVGVGALLAALILFLPQTTETAGAHGGEHAEDEAPRGPHGGRLLADGDRALEVVIFETGVEPQLRLYPYQGGEPVDPDALSLQAEVRRLGGVTDDVRFQRAGAFLRGDAVIYEPHSFDIVMTGTWGGQPVSFVYEQVEGRVEMGVEQAEASGIVVAEAGPATIASEVELPGEVQLNTDRVSRVAPRLSGTVVAVPVGLGQRVGAGATLAVIESRELGQAQGEYVESLHRLELAQSTYERERRLWERQISATREYEQARHDLEEAELEVQRARASLRALGIGAGQLDALGVEPSGRTSERRVRSPLGPSLTRYAVRAPAGGQVLERNVSVGQQVSGMEEAFVVADLSTVWVEVTVYANALGAVRAGQAVVVEAQGDSLGAQRGRGTVRFVGPLVGEATRTARALVVLDNPDGRWRPGEFVTATVTQDQTTVPVAVPREAVQTWREMPVVFARFGDVFEVRPVTLGRQNGDVVEITSGLDRGQPYVAAGAYTLLADLLKEGASHDH